MNLDFDNTAICLFVYNRPDHTRQVLSGLAKNRIPHLYIFHDGLRPGHDPSSHQKVAEVIGAIDFCKTTVANSTANRGVDRSIILGVTHVLKTHEAVMVLEDDCVPSSTYSDYVFYCLNRFRMDRSVFSISGYGYPGLREIEDDDVCFSPLSSSWGWATWKDRWSEFDPENQDWKKILDDPRQKARFDLPGNLFSTLLGKQARGEIDVWDILWYYTHFKNNAMCIWPTQSQIKNIGMDGTGVHCSDTTDFDVELCETFNAATFRIPAEHSFSHQARKVFQKNYTIPTDPAARLDRRLIQVFRTPNKWPEMAVKLIKKLSKSDQSR